MSPSERFADRVLRWFDEHGRKDLPWQQRRDPYPIWVSEIMLQQTQVATVIPYFERFMTRFPDLESLAEADADELMQYWSGLGYYARARNLHAAAQQLVAKYQGEFPRDLDALVALPGLGRSTAAAVLSLAFDVPEAILDGNVKRVLARHAAVAGWPGKAATQKRLWALAEARTPEHRTAAYNQAMMDLGATLCTRGKPACERCPVSTDCEALRRDEVSRYPESRPRARRPQRQTTMLIALCEGQVFMERRPPSGIWGGLWSFPEVDGSADDWLAQRFAVTAESLCELDLLRHSFSHFDLDIRPVVVRLDEHCSKLCADEVSRWVDVADSPKIGLAAPVSKLLQTIRTL